MALLIFTDVHPAGQQTGDIRHLVTQEMVMELWRSTPARLVGGEYVRISPGRTVMQLPSVRIWDMPVDQSLHPSLLAAVSELLFSFTPPAVHPALGT